MSYTETERRSDLNIKQDDMLASKRFVIERKPDTSYFYELEEAVVLDVILDDKHPAFTDELDANDFPPNIDGSEPVSGTNDYGQIGAIKFRFLNSERGKDKEQLGWAYPIENTGITEWPLMNEMVIVGRYMESYFYSRKLNFKSVVNSNASFITERVSGWVSENTDEYNNGEPYTGPKSVMNFFGGENYKGVLGNYFKFNPKIRSIKRYEGDTILESRFGSSIRFGAYDDNRNNDSGIEGEYEDGGGNPKIILRNRQAPIKNPEGFTAKGYTEEDINKDGSSVHITSGKTVSKFKTTCQKIMFSKSIKQEQPKFSPDGSTDFDYPKQDGEQIVINSDRLIFSSKANETIHFSKKRYAIVTDDEYTVDSNKQIVLTTNEKTVLNSPFIFLGEFEQAAEPVLLGRTTTAWDMALCDWILLQTEWMIELCEEWLAKHLHDLDSHKDVQVAPKSEWVSKLNKHISDLKKLREKLIELRDRAPKNMSNRVFTVGGGGAPGQKGGELVPDSASDANQSSKENKEMGKSESAPVDMTKKKYKIELIYSGGGEKSPLNP